MLDRAAFLRPIAHRGLHNAKHGIIENTAAAFEAAIAKNYGIECDVRPAAGGVPIVFHDLTLERLIDGKGRVDALQGRDLKRLLYRGATDQQIITLSEMLDLVGGRVPVFVEIKSEWGPVDAAFIKRIAATCSAYKGAVATMSFDPDVMAAMRERASSIPRGIVSGKYVGRGWWSRQVPKARATRLAALLESGPVAPSFYAYDISALPTAETAYARGVQGVPLLTWTVRTQRDRKVAAAHADAMIFEGFEA
jgi:glycerophosphoryl diester phosphodiesterase